MIRIATVLAALLFVGSTSFARSLSPVDVQMIADGVDRVLLIDGVIEDVSHAVPKCGPPEPGADPCMNVTLIKVAFHLGCLDDIAVTHVATVNKRTNKIVVDVTALHLANQKSRVAMCMRENVKVAMIEVRSELSQVEASDVKVVFQKKFTDVRL